MYECIIFKRARMRVTQPSNQIFQHNVHEETQKAADEKMGVNPHVFAFKTSNSKKSQWSTLIQMFIKRRVKYPRGTWVLRVFKFSTSVSFRITGSTWIWKKKTLGSTCQISRPNFNFSPRVNRWGWHVAPHKKN
jgi:hypothetical protein